MRTVKQIMEEVTKKKKESALRFFETQSSTLRLIKKEKTEKEEQEVG